MKNMTETRVALLELSIDHISNTLVRMESKMDVRFDKLDARIERINDRQWSNFIWLLGIMTGLTLGGLGILAKGFHWL